MNGTLALEDLLVLILASLVPALIFLSWIRTSERYRQTSWGTVLSLFAFGAVVATIVAGILEVVLVDAGNAASKSYPAPEFSFLKGNSTAGTFFLVLVIAPFVEEGLKAVGVARYRDRIGSVADGPVFGASVGLGFGFFETFLYGLGAFLVGGLVAGLTLIFIRSISSVLLHGSSTAMFGYGFAASKVEGRSGASGGYYLLAVAMHSSFNVLASLGSVALALGYSGQVGNYADALGLVLAVVFAIAAINHVVTVIHQSTFPSAGGAPARYRPPTIARRPPPGATQGNR
ncbi:MAG: PrsW family intramembrane metalloprotease [Thermoplasmata archaeon]|nr:PrsW family intramembrane metalloprotease [Thermoplasmata archaeon]MCI4359791.1 PrsW family intramembrane metalloprotease [Thermoplasmata archaeon]